LRGLEDNGKRNRKRGTNRVKRKNACFCGHRTNGKKRSQPPKKLFQPRGQKTTLKKCTQPALRAAQKVFEAGGVPPKKFPCFPIKKAEVGVQTHNPREKKTGGLNCNKNRATKTKKKSPPAENPKKVNREQKVKKRFSKERPTEGD